MRIATLSLGYLLTSSKTFRPVVHDTFASKSVLYAMDTFPVTFSNVRTFADMAYRAYLSKDSIGWMDTDLNQTTTLNEKDSVQAHLFSTADKQFNVLAFKGTSTFWTKVKPDSSVYNDKFNDNLFYSCCFHVQSSLFDCKQRCPILSRSQACCNECYAESLSYEQNYYNIANNVTQRALELLPRDATIAFVGHSLGGTLATMMGVTHNKQVVTFQSPGERNYMERSGIKFTTEHTRKIHHFGHNADPVFTGRCNGMFSLCYLGGYNIYTKCHIGHRCEYDAQKELSIHESIFTHPIKYVLENVIDKWNNTLPACSLDTHCEECLDWSTKNR